MANRYMFWVCRPMLLLSFFVLALLFNQTEIAVYAKVPAPQLMVTGPVAGSIATTGNSLSIQWTYKGDPGQAIKIMLLRENVAVQTIVADTPIGTANQGKYNWIIPAALSPGNNYQISITSTTNSKYSAVSSDFTIMNKIRTELSKPGITVTAVGKVLPMLPMQITTKGIVATGNVVNPTSVFTNGIVARGKAGGGGNIVTKAISATGYIVVPSKITTPAVTAVGK